MSDIRHHRSERTKPDCAQAQPAPNLIPDLRTFISEERGPESVRGLCRAVVPRLRDEGGFALLKQRDPESIRGFTLLELVIVIGIIAILLVLGAPAFTTLTRATDVSSDIYGVKGVLDNARAYAKANHTFVFVGFAEVDSSVDPSVSPQVTTGDRPYGRVAMAVVAAKDGTSQYEYATTDQGNDWKANYANGAHLIAVGKLQTYENLHFVPLDFGSWTPTAHPDSKMARYQPTGPPYILSNALSKSVTPFTWPLGSALDSGYQYLFDRVINFDPTGIARIASSTNGDAIAHVIEIDFQPAHGTLFQPLPADFNQDVGSHAVIQLGTTSGAVRVYRP
ncbi:MAG: type II secretion system protein [Candidatus Udaeobacter sp.]